MGPRSILHTARSVCSFWLLQHGQSCMLVEPSARQKLINANDAVHCAGKTIFITGGSRGIGKAIALRAARDGANIIIAAKTDQPNPKLPGTIHTTAAQGNRSRGRLKALAVMCDIRFEDQIAAAVEQAVSDVRRHRYPRQ